jgi:hypothetical protein
MKASISDWGERPISSGGKSILTGDRWVYRQVRSLSGEVDPHISLLPLKSRKE